MAKLNPLKQAVQDLTRARKILTPRSVWIQDQYEDGEQVCAIGALARAQNQPYWRTETEDNCAHEFLKRALPRGYDNVPDYNDAYLRSHSSILKLFDRAIEEAKRAARAPTKAPKGSITR